MKKPKILIVEDEAIVALELKLTLEFRGYEIVGIASKADEAVAMALTADPDIILMDVFLKGRHGGIDAAARIRKQRPVPIVYMTGNTHLRSDERLRETEPAAVLSKPPSPGELLTTLEEVLKNPYPTKDAQR